MSLFKELRIKFFLIRWAGTKRVGKNKRILVKRSYIFYDKVMISVHWSLREVYADGKISNPSYCIEERASEYYVERYVKKIEKHTLPGYIAKFAKKIGEEL